MADYKKKLEDLVTIIVKEGGSDLHISEERHPAIRVSGELVPLVKQEVLTKQDTVGILALLLSEEKQKKFLENQEIDFSYTDADKVRFRGSAYLQQGAVSIVLRIIPTVLKSLEELGLPPLLTDFARQKQGFFLVVGPVGQGKSTTLASLVNVINREQAAHIITVEDPVEFLFTEEQSVIDQREVGSDTGSFQSALQSMFRQDVDVVMIGEMRDPDTISTAVTAAETGHLVFSTLHTNNAAQTIDRILDSFPPDQQRQIRVQLSQSLLGIFSQRLITRVSGGLIPAYELLINNSAVANLIREGRTHEINVVIETGLDEGMIDMNRTLVELVRKGEITAQDARSYSFNPRGLDRLI